MKKKNYTTSPFLWRETLSTSEDAVWARNKRLNNPAFAEQQAEKSHRRYGRKRTVELLNTARLFRPARKLAESRLRFHISKGRTAGDIGIRENIPVVDVEKQIAELGLTPAAR